MAIKNRKSSGLDIENMLDGIDQQKEIEQTTNESIKEMNRVLDRINGAIGELEDYKHYLMGIIDNIKTSSQQIEIATKNNQKVCAEISSHIQKLMETPLTTCLDQKSLDKFKVIGDKHLADQKALFDSTDRNMRRFLYSFMDEFKRNLDEKGFWCSDRVFRWLMPVFIASIGFNMLVIVLWIASHLG